MCGEILYVYIKKFMVEIVKEIKLILDASHSSSGNEIALTAFNFRVASRIPVISADLLPRQCSEGS